MNYEQKKEQILIDKIEFYKKVQNDLLSIKDSISIEEPYKLSILEPNCENNKFNYDRGFFTSAYIYYKNEFVATISPNLCGYRAGFESFQKKFHISIRGVFSELKNEVIYLLTNEGGGLLEKEKEELYDFFGDNNFETLQECLDKVLEIHNKIKVELNRFLDKRAEFKKHDPTRYINCYDKFGEELFENDEVDVQQVGVHKIFKKEDGQLYFSPYEKEERVSSYFQNDIIKVLKK
jgi:predicted house-cleaning noncanonical NTP pyrophosphatase (MazG superfamily)